MASAFQVSVTELEEETAALIMANQLQARIDSQNKTLHRRQVDRRDAGYLKVRSLNYMASTSNRSVCAPGVYRLVLLQDFARRVFGPYAVMCM